VARGWIDVQAGADAHGRRYLARLNQRAELDSRMAQVGRSFLGSEIAIDHARLQACGALPAPSLLFFFTQGFCCQCHRCTTFCFVVLRYGQQ